MSKLGFITKKERDDFLKYHLILYIEGKIITTNLDLVQN